MLCGRAPLLERICTQKPRREPARSWWPPAGPRAAWPIGVQQPADSRAALQGAVECGMTISRGLHSIAQSFGRLRLVHHDPAGRCTVTRPAAKLVVGSRSQRQRQVVSGAAACTRETREQQANLRSLAAAQRRPLLLRCPSEANRFSHAEPCMPQRKRPPAGEHADAAPAAAEQISLGPRARVFPAGSCIWWEPSPSHDLRLASSPAAQDRQKGPSAWRRRCGGPWGERARGTPSRGGGPVAGRAAAPCAWIRRRRRRCCCAGVRCCGCACRAALAALRSSQPACRRAGGLQAAPVPPFAWLAGGASPGLRRRRLAAAAAPSACGMRLSASSILRSIPRLSSTLTCFIFLCSPVRGAALPSTSAPCRIENGPAALLLLRLQAAAAEP